MPYYVDSIVEVQCTMFKGSVGDTVSCTRTFNKTGPNSVTMSGPDSEVNNVQSYRAAIVSNFSNPSLSTVNRDMVTHFGSVSAFSILGYVRNS